MKQYPLDTIKGLAFKVEEELCAEIDEELYLPVKQELEGHDVPYSLGLRKEDFKETMSIQIGRILGLIEQRITEIANEQVKLNEKINSPLLTTEEKNNSIRLMAQAHILQIRRLELQKLYDGTKEGQYETENKL